MDKYLYWMEQIAHDLNIAKLPELRMDPFMQCCFGYDSDHIMNSFINLNPDVLSWNDDPILVLAHEMRHVWQIQNRLLEPIPNTYEYVLWKGEVVLVSGNSHEEHILLPHEVDANEYAEQWKERLATKVA